MKITYLANVRLPTERAYGIQIIQMCRAFALQGAEVTLLFPFRISRAIKGSVFEYYSIDPIFSAKKLHVLDFYLPGILNKAAFHIKNLISACALVVATLRERGDKIYSRDELPIYLLSFFKDNLCFEAHTFSPARTLYYRRFRARSVKVIVISEALKEEFVRFGFSENLVLVAPDGVDIESFGGTISKDEARQKLNLPLDAYIVMYSGHLFERKGAHVLAQAAPLLPEALFVFVGGTDREVQQFKKNYGQGSNIVIVGYRPHKEVPIYLQAADVLVLPNSAKESVSDQFTSPLKLFEYMASRRPIVASDLKVLREVLHDASAVFVPADQPEPLAQALETLQRNKELRAQLAERAFADVTGYTWEARAKIISKFI